MSCASSRSRRRRTASAGRPSSAGMVARRVGGEDAAGAVDHRGHAGALERRADQRRVAVGAHEHGDVARTHALARDLGVRGQHADHVGGEVGGDVVARRLVAGEARGGPLDRVARDHPDAQRRAVQPARRVAAGGAHAAVLDPLVAEPRVSEQRVEALEEGLVAAPVGAQRGALARRGGRIEIGVDVGAAEGVDRLLGCRRRSSTSVPPPAPNARCTIRHCSGSVSWNSSTRTTSYRARSRAAVPASAERGVEPPRAGRRRSSRPAGACAARVPRGPRPRAGGASPAPRRPPARSARRGSRRRRTRSPPPARDRTAARRRGGSGGRRQVVDDVLHQVAEILDEGDARLEVSGDAQAAEHLLSRSRGSWRSSPRRSRPPRA